MTRAQMQGLIETMLSEVTEMRDQCEHLRVLALGCEVNLSVLLGRVRHQADDEIAVAAMRGTARAISTVLGEAIDRHTAVVDESADGRLRDAVAGLRSVAEVG